MVQSLSKADILLIRVEIYQDIDNIYEELTVNFNNWWKVFIEFFLYAQKTEIEISFYNSEI